MLREKYPYSQLLWSTVSRIQIEYGEILHISPNSVRMRENADQNNSEYGHFLRSVVSWLSYESKQTKTDLLVYTNILTLFIVSICEIF